MEYLSGYLPHSIRQDFYTAICQYNVAKFLHQLADKELQATPKEHNPRRNAKEYKKQANMALASSLALKALAMQIYNPSGVENFINLSIHLLCRFPEPVRPHRQYPRKKKVHKSRGRIRYDTNFKQTG